MLFKDFPVNEVGHKLQLIGAVWSDGETDYLCVFPEFDRDGMRVDGLEQVSMTAEDWKTLLRQSDLVETEVLAKAEDGQIVKVILRKSQRAVEQQVSWNVYRRDGFRCRYCGKDSIPLTVDHLVLWEEGGPSIEENLVSACRKCNKTRGRQQYSEWLLSDYYRTVCSGLDDNVRAANTAVLPKLADIPRVLHVRSR